MLSYGAQLITTHGKIPKKKGGESFTIKESFKRGKAYSFFYWKREKKNEFILYDNQV